MKRAADPYLDTDVIDSRAPRFNQAVIGTLALVGALTGAWWLLGLLALQLAVGLLFGRRYCLPCVAYFALVQPRLGEGPLEDARPPRVANMVGSRCSAPPRSRERQAQRRGGRARRPRRRARATGRGDGLLHRLRGVQARLQAQRPPVRLLPAAAAAGARRSQVTLCYLAGASG